jgi:FkbM family methyltransferase
MPFLNTLRFILDHPMNRGRGLRALWRYASWQIISRLRTGPSTVDFVQGTKLLVGRGQTGATGNIYAGLHEASEMAFVLHLLRAGELFVDIGANIGSYTVLAGGATKATCIAFEPGTAAFDALSANIALNSLERAVITRNIAVGERSGTIQFSVGQDTVNHVVSEGTSDETTTVHVTTLDAELYGRSPVLIKIDVEGFEFKVLAGARRTLGNPSLLALIVETNGLGSRYGDNDNDVDLLLKSHGFTPCSYDPFARNLTRILSPGNNGNTIYVREFASVSERLRAAQRFTVAGGRAI